MITLEELVNNRLLSLPKVDSIKSVSKLRGGDRFRSGGGVYTFYNQYHEPLYVGISCNVGKRVLEHLGSSKGNTDLVNYTKSKDGVYVSVFYEENKAYQEIYESYLISTLNPRFNVMKTGRDRI